jgi:hypothetical protein
MLPPSSSLKNELNKKSTGKQVDVLLVSCLAYSFDLEDDVVMFLRNLDCLSKDYRTLYPRR